MAARARSSTAAPRRTRRTGDQIRGLLLQSARELFASKGFSGTTTREIAERSGVAEQSLFEHFDSKQGLFEAAVLKPFNDFVHAYTAEWIDSATNPDDPQELVARYVEGLYAVAREHRQLFLALSVAHLGHGPAQSLLDEIERWTTRIANDYGLTFDPKIAVRSVLALVTTMALLEEQLLPNRDRAEIISELTATILHGLLR